MPEPLRVRGAPMKTKSARASMRLAAPRSVCRRAMTPRGVPRPARPPRCSMTSTLGSRSSGRRGSATCPCRDRRRGRGRYTFGVWGGQEHRRLPGRVAAADDRDGIRATELRLDLVSPRSTRSLPPTPRSVECRARGTARRSRSPPRVPPGSQSPSSSPSDVVAVLGGRSVLPSRRATSRLGRRT